MSDAAYFDEEPGPLADDEYVDPPQYVAPEQAEPSTEDKARAQGWRPERRGKDGVSLTAEEFLAKGESEIPVLRHNMRLLTERQARTDKENGELRVAIKDAMGLARRASDAGYNRAIAELKADQRAAVATGDTEAYEQAEQQITAMETERAKEPAPVVPAAPAPQDARDPEIADFLDAPPAWFADATMRQALQFAHARLIKTNPGKRQGELLQDAINEVGAAFPGRIQGVAAVPTPRPNADTNASPPAPRDRRPAGVLTPGGATGGRPAARTDPFSRIAEGERADAKAAYARQAAWDEGFTADEYVGLYLGEITDPLAMRKARKK